MNHPLSLALAVALAAIATPAVAQSAKTDATVNASAKSSAAQAESANPFFAKSTLPLQYPHFDKIKDSDFGPAFDRGMAEQLTEIEAIANNKAKPTFDNTIVAMEKAGQLLGRTAAVFFNLTGADTNDVREKIQAAYAPKLSAHRDAISLNPKLFSRVKTLYDSRETLGLDAEGLRLVERYHTDFVRSGANLSDADKTKLKAINGELAKLGTQFSQNVLAEVNDSAIVVDTKAELDGLSAEQIAAAAEAAKSRKLEGKYVLALLNTTGQPPESQLTNRALRERLHKASVARGARGNKFDNTGIVATVTKLRADRARMMGYPTHAAYVLEDETAKTPEAVNAMLNQLAPPAVANARLEGADTDATTGMPARNAFCTISNEVRPLTNSIRSESGMASRMTMRPMTLSTAL